MVNLQSCKYRVRNEVAPLTLTLDPSPIQKDSKSVWSGYGADLVGGCGNIKMPGKFMYPKEALFPQVATHGKRDLGTAQCCLQAIRWFPAQSFHQLWEWFKAHLMKLNIKHQTFHKHRYWKHHGNEQLKGWLCPCRVCRPPSPPRWFYVMGDYFVSFVYLWATSTGLYHLVVLL